MNDSRTQLLANYASLSEEQLHRPLTESEHDPSNHWSALDHFAHLALVEHDFEQMIRRHLEGHRNPVGLLIDEAGVTRTRREIMAIVNARTETFQRAHHLYSLAQVVALTGIARASTLRLLSELSDVQLDEQLDGAPWADGTIGGVLGANGDHA